MNNKRSYGQYFTINNPFIFSSFKNWLIKAVKDTSETKILEPFCGANHIPNLVEEAIEDSFSWEWDCYDIDPNVIHKNKSTHKIKIMDVFKKFPTDSNIIITNPPYLAKNSAKRRSMDFPNIIYDDLYKFSLDLCLSNANYVAAIIPESFIVQNLFHNRLSAVISLTMKMFNDTECPVCLALFVPEKNNLDFAIYSNDIFIGNYLSLIKNKNFGDNTYPLKFNDKDGEISLFAIDNNKEDSIYFDLGDKIPVEKVKETSRSYSRIKLPFEFTKEDICDIIKVSNNILAQFRSDTHDIFITSFKGLRKDGYYRRRLDFTQAKQILSHSIDIVRNKKE